MFNILIADDVHESLMHGLQKAGIDFSYRPDISAEEIERSFPEFNALVVRSKINLDSKRLRSLEGLKLIARAGAGMETIDLRTAADLDIEVMNAGLGNRDAVGEQTVGMLLSLTHKIVKGNREIAQKIWDREGNRGREIGSMTIGLIGFGNTGSAVAEKLSGFGCRILAYDKYKSGFASHGVIETDLQTLLNRADVISFHVPLTFETRHWINDDFIRSVQNPFTLLNLSRGGIMDTKAILRGLDSGKITGFGSDVLENENLSTYSVDENKTLENLAQRDNVLLTPHVGGWTIESYEKISKVLLAGILYLSGVESPQNEHFNDAGLFVG